jgi:phosphoribosylanthranilate isomerase
MMIKVKICGVTNYDDALLVTNLGAEYIGFNFFKDSPRKVSVKMVKDVSAKLPPFVSAVGVFVDEDPAELVKTAKKCGLKALQLHGSESPEYCKDIAAKTGLPVIKAFRMQDENTIEQMKPYVEAVNYFLLDAYVPGVPGGTAETFNWDLAVKAKELGKPVFLAGGLTPDNVGDAVLKVQPFAVDACSGIERLPRRKDYDKMNQFIRHARGLK